VPWRTILPTLHRNLKDRLFRIVKKKADVPRYEMKFMFEWLSDTCLWSENDAAKERYGYPVDLADLPISKELKEKLERLIRVHDEALNWDDPGSGLVWREAQIEAFRAEALEAYEQLGRQLGSAYRLTYQRSF